MAWINLTKQGDANNNSNENNNNNSNNNYCIFISITTTKKAHEGFVCFQACYFLECWTEARI